LTNRKFKILNRIFPEPSLLNWGSLWGLLLVVSVVLSLYVAGVFGEDLVNVGGWSLFLRFFLAALSPEVNWEFLLLTLDASLKTLAYAVCGTFFSVVIGLVGGILCSEVWWKSLGKVYFYNTPWLVVRGILAIPRAIHELIWGLFFVNIFGLDPLVAVLAIAIPYGAITAKVFSDILDETPRSPLLALLNSGVTPLNAFLYSLIPQAFPNLVSYSFYRFECAIRSATVLGIIGAGGLGYQIFLSLQSLRYEQMWTLMFALLLLSGGTDLLSGLLRHRIDIPKNQHYQIAQQRHLLIQLLILGVPLLLTFSFWYINADFTKLWSPRTFQLLASVFQDIFPPDTTLFPQAITLSVQTLAMSILAITGAGIAGILFSFPAARKDTFNADMLPNKQNICVHLRPSAVKILTFLTRFLLLFARAVPEPIWALIFLFVLFPGILPGVIALGIHNFGVLGRLMAEVIENLDQRPLHSLKALGASPNQIFIYGVLPLTLPRFLAYILYRWEVCIRATVIVGLVGAGGLGRLLTEQLSSFDYNGLLTTLIVFVALTFIVDLISALVRRTLR
jgi:phosphonate transport system permease protein